MATTNTVLTEQQRGTLLNALAVATEQFNRDISTLRTEKATQLGERNFRLNTVSRLLDQFTGQINDCRTLALLIESSEAVIITTEVD
jgi:hypothetical protein